MARKVRLQWNAPRKQALLLYPEGALALNPTAQAVLELCDGRRTLAEMVRELAATFVGATEERTSSEPVPLSTDPGTGDVAHPPDPRAGHQPGGGVTTSASGLSGDPEGAGAAASLPERQATVGRDVRAFLDQLASRGWLVDESS